MKRRLLYLLATLATLFAIGVFAVACTANDPAAPNNPNNPIDPPANAVSYSVTVKNPDGALADGITVSWQSGDNEYGKATTADDGKATAELAPATYRVVLSGYAEGMTAPTVSVTSGMRDITLTLTYVQVKYTATVIDKTGAPAPGVTVTWVAGTTSAGSAKTNAEGVAECTLDYGEYTVTVSDLPEGNIANVNLTADGKSAAVRFELVDGNTATYTLTLRSEGMLKFADKEITVFSKDGLVALGYTDENGVYKFTLPVGEYRATLTPKELPDGYTTADVTFYEGTTSAEMVAHSEVISDIPQGAGFTYVMGDIFHDYTFTTPYEVDGEKLSLKISEVLAEKKAIFLNNWGTRCSYCVKEMPAMQAIYDKYKDVIEIIAVSNYNGGDTNLEIAEYYADNGYTFPMMRDTYDFSSKFELSGWPTTVIIDRYGAIARIESGALTDEGLWERLIEMYAGKEYIQTFKPGDRVSNSITSEVAKPDITLPADHYEQVAEVLNAADQFPEGASVEWYGAPNTEEYEYAWPFVVGAEKDVSPVDRVVYASNAGKHNSYAVLFATVNAPAGSVFTFDYYAETEQDYDILSILWDGMLVREISGDGDGWQTCKLYSDIAGHDHTLAIVYMKDASTHKGKDNVYIRNVRFTPLSEITEPTDMLRSAAYGKPEEGATQFPHYASVSLGNDGYYHVDLSALENSEYAGVDQTPMLFANLRNATNWMGNSINDLLFFVYKDTAEYVFDTVLTVNGVTRDYRADLIKYSNMAGYSDIPDFVPVDQELHDILIEFMKGVKKTLAENSDDDNADPTFYENEWLEICYFYSHYGSGEPMGNPVMGLSKKTALTANIGINTVNLYRAMQPFSASIYSFTPDQSAVYKFQSLLPANSKQATQIWVYDEATPEENGLYSGSDRLTRTGENEHNFELYVYLQAGKTYYMTLAYQMQDVGEYQFSITNVGQSASVLTPTAGIEYDMILDDKENILGMEVSHPVQYAKDDDGYYYALNPDGTKGSYIYLDLKYANAAMGTLSVEKMLDRNMVINDGSQYITLDFKTFDFGRTNVYARDGQSITGMDPDYDLSGVDEMYKDYTERLREIVASAPQSGETAGMVRVNDEIKLIIELFAQLRTNSTYYNTQTDQLILTGNLENEWLRFCWYFRLYDENNTY